MSNLPWLHCRLLPHKGCKGMPSRGSYSHEASFAGLRFIGLPTMSIHVHLEVVYNGSQIAQSLPRSCRSIDQSIPPRLEILSRLKPSLKLIALPREYITESRASPSAGYPSPGLYALCESFATSAVLKGRMTVGTWHCRQIIRLKQGCSLKRKDSCLPRGQVYIVVVFGLVP